MKQNSNYKRNLKDELIDLYLSIKIIIDNKVILFYKQTDTMKSIKKKLESIDSLTIINYIKTSIEILTNKELKKESILQELKENRTPQQSFVDPPKDYELMIQTLEAEVRDRIRIEQELRVSIE